MRRPTSFLITLVVAAALALPMPAAAQATRRGGGSDDSGSSGGGATTRSAPSGGESSGGSAAPRVAMPRVSPAPSSSPSEPSSSRPSSRSGGVSARPSGATPSGSPARVRSAGISSTTGLATGATRVRGARAASGFAQPRASAGPNDPSIWLPYYPWYSSRLNPHFGFGFGYDPWGYGYSRWSRYGSWYDPFGYPYGYGVFGYDPYGFGLGHHYWGAPYYVSVDQRDDDRQRDRAFGSLRLRASPENARVYIDGALAGTVDDFNGLSNHLELEQGVHQLELRADGYEAYTTEIAVEAGKTRTARASMKRLDN